MGRDLNEILRGGYCTRWHANPQMAHIRETLAEHHARVAQILLALHPSPSLSLIDAALHHDAGEPRVGDVPWPVKRDNPSLAALLDEIEAGARRAIGCEAPLSAAATAGLTLAERVAGWMHVAQSLPGVLSEHEWQRDEAVVLDMARAVGAYVSVNAVMSRATRKDKGE